MSHDQIAKIIVTLISVFLLIDTINGFFLLGMGVDLKISVFYKSFLLVFLIIYLIKYNLKVVLATVVFFVLFMAGEVATIFGLTSSAEKLSFVVQHITKLITPFLLFFFLLDRSNRDPNIYLKIERVMLLNCIFFLANIFIGVLGFGFSTYGGSVTESSVGVKGFFYAGNEISTLLVIFAGFYLSKTYLKSKLAFLFFSVFWIGVGFLISTKTAMLAIIVLSLCIPIIFEGPRIFLLNNLVSIVFMAIVLVIIVQAFFIYEIFKDTMIYGRLDFMYRKSGMLGIIFSGRSTFLVDMWAYFYKELSVYTLLLGNGVSYYADSIKYAVELDIPDVFFWHGILGVAIVLFIFMTLTAFSARNFFSPYHPYAATIFLVNMMLFGISNFSGHVFTSGMLGFLWPCFAILAKYSSRPSDGLEWMSGNNNESPNN